MKRFRKPTADHVVTLHQFPRGRTCPNPSPFALKLETFLRMSSIPYVVDDRRVMSAKYKTPWITFRGKSVADSQLCIEHLTGRLGRDVSARLGCEERAMARAVRIMMEDHFYFCFVLERWVYGDTDYVKDKVFAPLPLNKFMSDLIYKNGAKLLYKQCHGQGMARHSKREVRSMGLHDLQAVSHLLGEKPFLMGSEPSEVDCVLFGFTAQILFAMPEEGNVYREALEDILVNLKAHCFRMKERFWTDWDQCLYGKGG